MKCRANCILHHGFVRHNRIASRNVAKNNRNQLFAKISKQFPSRDNSSLRPEVPMILWWRISNFLACVPDDLTRKSSCRRPA